MTRIDATQALAALIRRQVESMARQPNPRTGGQTTSNSMRATTAREDLASVVARRVRALDPAGPDARRKAFRVFLEATLAAKFGESLMNDPAFHLLVDDVQERMSEQPELARWMDLASQALLEDQRS